MNFRMVEFVLDFSCKNKFNLFATTEKTKKRLQKTLNIDIIITHFIDGIHANMK